MTPTLGIVDYGSGNFGSVWNAGLRLGVSLVAIQSRKDVARCTHIVLPGVGAFGAAMAQLNERDLAAVIVEEGNAGLRPLLGICVGMQVLAELGREFGEHRGLGLVAGTVEKIEPEGLPLPHMGWNSVEAQNGSPLFAGMDGEPTFYFVHSFHMMPADPGVIAAKATYGGSVVAAVSKGAVHGVQFHPEKSQEHGLRLLENFSGLGT